MAIFLPLRPGLDRACRGDTQRKTTSFLPLRIGPGSACQDATQLREGRVYAAASRSGLSVVATTRSESLSAFGVLLAPHSGFLPLRKGPKQEPEWTCEPYPENRPMKTARGGVGV